MARWLIPVISSSGLAEIEVERVWKSGILANSEKRGFEGR
jgi:hypothetical protein